MKVFKIDEGRIFLDEFHNTPSSRREQFSY